MIVKSYIIIRLRGAVGSGKTQVGEKIIETLQKEGLKVKWFDEDQHLIEIEQTKFGQKND